MRKLMLVLLALGASLALIIAGSPADAEHAPEGVISVALVEACSNDADTPADGKCTWTASEPSGWVGVGPWTLTYTDAVGSLVTIECAAGASCQSEGETDPIPTGSTVSTDTSAGGAIAAGDPEEGEGE